MDSGWFTSLLNAYFESFASAELPIWRVFKETSSWPGEPVSGTPGIPLKLAAPA
jgi:hypothetical protein